MFETAFSSILFDMNQKGYCLTFHFVTELYYFRSRMMKRTIINTHLKAIE